MLPSINFFHNEWLAQRTSRSSVSTILVLGDLCPQENSKWQMIFSLSDPTVQRFDTRVPSTKPFQFLFNKLACLR